jgi:iron complex outermembrane recepter protein
MSARSGSFRSATLALWTVLALGFSWCANAAGRISFDIPRGPASETLRQYQQVTGLQFIFDFDKTRHIVTNPVQGRYDAIEALAILTRGTPIRYELDDGGMLTVSIEPATPPTKPRRTAAGEPTMGPLPSGDRRSLQAEVVIRSQRDRPTIGQPSSSLLNFSRQDIEAFGFATTEDVIRTLPQIFGGGPTEDTHQIGFEAQKNAGFGTGVNLRGLGAGSTLVLVNGRRLAGSGSEGIFTDISSIPLAIVDRIEILPDSSSSVYGADAVGGVVNFVLLDSFDGAQTDARFGTATHGQLDQNRLSQLFGTKTRFGDALVAFDFYSRDALPAADRAQGTSDLRAFGGDNFDVNQTNPATILAGTKTWQVPQGQDGTHLTPADLLPGQNFADKYADADLLPSQQRWSLYGSGKTNINEDVQLFADVLFSQRDVRNIGGHNRQPLAVPATNPFNPFDSPVQVAYDLTDDLGLLIGTVGVRTRSIVLGSDMRLPLGWHVTATGNFASEDLSARNDNALDAVALAQALADPNRETAFNPFGDGSHTNPETLDRIRGTSFFETDSRLWTADITASHDLPGLQGGTGKLVTGVDARRQTFKSALLIAGNFVNVGHDMDRTVSAAFIAASVPFIGKKSETSRVNRLEANVAARYENYSDFGHIITPRFGLTWSPLNGLAVRGTWSTSFRPPNLIDLDETSNGVLLQPVLDARAPGGLSFAAVQAGKNANLREERARSWTLGMDFEIPAVPRLSAAVTYFNTTFRDRMNEPVFNPATVLTDSSLARLVNLNPTAEQRQAVCDSAPVFGGTKDLCLTAPILADYRVRNSALMHTDGIDMLTEYVREWGGNSASFRLDGTYILSFREQQSAPLPMVEGVSTQNHPIDLRLRSAADWQHGPFRTGLLINYFDNYRDLASTPHRRVGSWTTVDLNLSYTLRGQRNGLLAGTTFSLNADNVFDELPPFLNNGGVVGLGYDQENGDLLGRMLSISIRKNW